MKTFLTGMAFLGLLAAAVVGEEPPGSRQARADAGDLEALFRYVREGWSELRRSNADVLKAALDPKLEGSGSAVLYLSEKEDLSRVREELRSQMPGEDFARLELRQLPAAAGEQGLLYLPHPYVVPGGRFNEMYGWDSYFIALGLVRDGEILAAKAMTDNHLYQVEHYGKVLNANRTYFLTRSQPPFLSRMVLEVFERTGDRDWLRRALPAIEKYHRFWIEPPHLTATGLSRYYDQGDGPAPEVVSGERDAEGRTHYDRIQEFFRRNQVTDYNLALYYDRGADRLTPLFYKGDRSMRESGFDPSNRFGAFNLDVIHYNPVELNTLLWVTERDLARIQTELGNTGEARGWERRAEERQRLVDRYLWDPQSGLYLDYNILTGKRRHYPFATTFFPLWAGMASPEQAARVAANLSLLERPGGIVTSTTVSGNQWDAPFGWAPLQMMAVEGLRRYGYETDADRIAIKFLSLVLGEFLEHDALVEKYDVVRRSSQVSEGIRFGYSSNEVGFGWTNAVFARLYDQLDPEGRSQVLELEVSPESGQ